MQGLFLTFTSQINFVQSEYASLVVNSTFNAEASRLFCSFENNSAAFNNSSLRNVRVAAELAALSNRTTNTQWASYRGHTTLQGNTNWRRGSFPFRQWRQGFTRQFDIPSRRDQRDEQN
ncbi:hypothetical protein ElyMa_004309200 [Elysia marginata]|uniref:Uncharacterized protein n=1 Tax=Elysia marginata TaxID=1093978 RepID=A0AAV4H1I2_9GAST|nr:hypothetical protein ElyMa_004309200 [Elysia marginata]